MTEKVHSGVERLTRELVGRIRGKFMFDEEEAIAEIRRALAKPVSRKNNGYIATSDTQHKPWTPGDPKPGSA